MKNTQSAAGPEALPGTVARPVPVTVSGWLFLVAGLIGVAYHGKDFLKEGPFQYDLVWVCLVRLLAVVGAVFVLDGRNWARWLLVFWMVYHVALSAFHSVSEVVIHTLLLALIAGILFSAKASAYFRGRKPQPALGPATDGASSA